MNINCADCKFFREVEGINLDKIHCKPLQLTFLEVIVKGINDNEDCDLVSDTEGTLTKKGKEMLFKNSI